jgi:hypothetical protein
VPGRSKEIERLYYLALGRTPEPIFRAALSLLPDVHDAVPRLSTREAFLTVLQGTTDKSKGEDTPACCGLSGISEDGCVGRKNMILNLKRLAALIRSWPALAKIKRAKAPDLSPLTGAECRRLRELGYHDADLRVTAAVRDIELFVEAEGARLATKCAKRFVRIVVEL